MEKTVTQQAEEEIEKTKTDIYLNLFNSLYEQLTTSSYFPGLNPEYSGDAYLEKSISERKELRKEAIARIQKDFSLVLLAQCYWQAIEEITDEDPITLFEAALLIGYRIDGNPNKLLASTPALFLDAFINGEIDPIDPVTRIPYSKLHESPVVIDNDIVFIKKNVDLSWRLTLEEVAQFAILKGYPEHLFTDLLSEASTTEATLAMEIKESEKTKLLKIIGLLTELLADYNCVDFRRKSDNSIVIGSGTFGDKEQNNLLFELLTKLDALESAEPIEIKGLGKSTLTKAINDGLKALRNN